MPTTLWPKIFTTLPHSFPSQHLPQPESKYLIYFFKFPVCLHNHENTRTRRMSIFVFCSFAVPKTVSGIQNVFRKYFLNELNKYFNHIMAWSNSQNISVNESQVATYAFKDISLWRHKSSSHSASKSQTIFPFLPYSVTFIPCLLWSTGIIKHSFLKKKKRKKRTEIYLLMFHYESTCPQGRPEWKWWADCSPSLVSGCPSPDAKVQTAPDRTPATTELQGSQDWPEPQLEIRLLQPRDDGLCYEDRSETGPGKAEFGLSTGSESNQQFTLEKEWASAWLPPRVLPFYSLTSPSFYEEWNWSLNRLF